MALSLTQISTANLRRPGGSRLSFDGDYLDFVAIHLYGLTDPLSDELARRGET